MAALASAARPVFPSRQPWAWQCMVITTRAQSACMQEPNKQNRQTVEGICCALDMIWMQDVFSISHSSDSWDFYFFFSGWKGESRLHSCSVCACKCVCVRDPAGLMCLTVGSCVHTPVHIHILQSSDTASHRQIWQTTVLSPSKTMERRWLGSSTWFAGIQLITAVCFTLAMAL